MIAIRAEIDCYVLPCSGADWFSDCPPSVWSAALTAHDGDEVAARAQLRGGLSGYFFRQIDDGGVMQSARDAFGVDHVRLLVR